MGAGSVKFPLEEPPQPYRPQMKNRRLQGDMLTYPLQAPVFLLLPDSWKIPINQMAGEDKTGKSGRSSW
jgi:hypothetical protein